MHHISTGAVTRLVLAALAVSATLSLANAHGPAEWIQRGNYKNAAGELCCGERDCGFMIGGTISHEVGGFRVNAEFQVGDGTGAIVTHVEEFVPEFEATPSPDGSYWRCQWGGSRKCFFAPPPST